MIQLTVFDTKMPPSKCAAQIHTHHVPAPIPKNDVAVNDELITFDNACYHLN